MMIEKIHQDYKDKKWRSASSLEGYILNRYGWDLSTNLGGVSVKNPFGKGAGQLSLNTSQVENDAVGGLGFVVLKTVIAQDERGDSVQSAWMVDAPKMKVEQITAETGELGWTVSWKGRGWSGTFAEYIDFVKTAQEIGKQHNTTIVPSCQIPLFKGPENPYENEYVFTLESLAEVLQNTADPLLELDLSPTLLKDEPGITAAVVLEQMEYAIPAARRLLPPHIKLGLKLFNLSALEEQIKLVQDGASIWRQLDWLTIGNRLFNEQKGISYGGYDLSNRNLAVLDAVRKEEKRLGQTILPRNVSGTGNICSGRMMVEYALRGCTTGHLHTYFQLPRRVYGHDLGSRTVSALHELIFNPQEGLIVTLERVRMEHGLENEILKYDDFFQNRSFER